jgi:hypothetical protein
VHGKVPNNKPSANLTLVARKGLGASSCFLAPLRTTSATSQTQEFIMARQGYGFSYVQSEGFTSFSEKLNVSPWRDLDITPYDTPARKLSNGILALSTPVLLKLMMKWALDDLRTAELPTETLNADTVDRTRWDPPQKQLNKEIAAAESRPDPEDKAAATRLRAALLKGRGTQQTQLPIPQEVRFGYAQVLKARSDTLSKDVARFNLTNLIDEIYKATQALDQASGYTERNKRQTEGLSRCVSTFNWVVGTLDLLLPSANEQERTLLQTMRDPLQKLLDDYPAPTDTSDEDPPTLVDPEPTN